MLGFWKGDRIVRLFRAKSVPYDQRNGDLYQSVTLYQSVSKLFIFILVTFSS
jgi:hypothetical protein